MDAFLEHYLTENARKFIGGFLKDRYGGDWGVDFGDLTDIPLAYCMASDGCTEMVVSADVVHRYINAYYADDGVLLRKVQFDSLQQMFEALPGLDFEGIAFLTDEEVDVLDARLTEAYERSKETGMQMEEVEPIVQNYKDIDRR